MARTTSVAAMEKVKAVTAAAHKLARLTYSLPTKGEEYTDQGQAYYDLIRNQPQPIHSD